MYHLICDENDARNETFTRGGIGLKGVGRQVKDGGHTSVMLYLKHCLKPYLKPHNISTTVHAMTKLFALFCSAKDGEFADMDFFLVF